MDLKCKICGNDKFYARGTLTHYLFDSVDAEGTVHVDDSYDEHPEIKYTSIECQDCGAEVTLDMSKEEADKIIEGAYEWLRWDEYHYEG